MPNIMDYETYLKSDKNAKVAKNGKSLSDTENQYNRALYDKYIKQATLEGQRQAALVQNEDTRKNALREQAVLSEKAKKYLGQQLALSGRAKTGAAESSMLDLFARQANARNEINQSYKGKESDIMLEYDRQLNQVDADTNARLMDIEADADAQKRTDRAEGASTLAQNLEAFKNNQISFETLKDFYSKNADSLDSSKDANLIRGYEVELNKQNAKKYILSQFRFEPTKIISAEDAVASEDSNVDSFGGWNPEASRVVIAMGKNGELDKYAQLHNGEPFMIDVDGSDNTRLYMIYYKGQFIEVPQEHEDMLEDKLPAYVVHGDGIAQVNPKYLREYGYRHNQ